MRVISGSARGLRLLVPKGTSVRPTSDRVREAVFNSLGSLGAVVGASVVDLFAGSGALGIEALSRGALECTFCESDPRAVTVVRRNLEHTRTGESARVVVGDTMKLLSGGGPLEGITAGVAFADPPYDFDRWDELLDLIEATEVWIVVAESDHPLEPSSGWLKLKERAYGGTVVTILERSQGSDSQGPDSQDPDPDSPDRHGSVPASVDPKVSEPIEPHPREENHP